MKRTETVEIPMQTRVASVSPASIDEQKRTVELVWSTGAAVKRMDWRSGEIFEEQLSMDPAHVRLGRLNGGAPLLDTHGRYSLSDVIGVVEQAWIANGEGRAVVRFSSRAEVEPLWKEVLDGIIRNVSVGYSIHKFEDVTQRDAKTKTMLATDWEPSEISLVPIGADAKAGVRAEGDRNTCEITSGEVSEQSERTDSDGAAGAGIAGEASMKILRLQLELSAKEV